MGAETALALTAVGVGALVQGSVGFGFALVVVPTMALLRPEAVPVTVLFLAFPIATFMVLREHRSIDVAGFVWITLGRLPGTAAGVGLLTLVSQDLLTVLIGLLVVAAALVSFFGPSFEVRAVTQFAGGAASGVTAITAALGGPPLALVYQKRPGPELRSTLALSFLLGLFISLSALAIAGRVEREHALLALQLLPALLIGLWTSRRLTHCLDERWLKPTVLAFAAIAGLIVIILGPLG